MSNGFRLALRTNLPPKDIDEQAIPSTLKHVIKLKETAKTIGTLKRKRKKKNALISVGVQQHERTLHPKARREKVVPVLQQKPGESGEQFWHRVSRDTYAFIKETAFEKKYGIQVERDPKTGSICSLTKCKADADDIERLRLKHNNTGKKTTTLTKNEKRRLKLKAKLRVKESEEDEFEKLQDKVAFGEVAHEPPRLNIKKESNKRENSRSLLLNSLLEGSKKTASASKIIDRSKKRKNLPILERKRLEMQQSEVIAAYKQLKSQRLAH